ncbi:hypothetical protein [Musicola paradisiaca]|uniref:MotA/TolQ/ExbB proton channel domain-containing protein n=1 Tax=Musicola paradisiaca (strain Ech703) TaxID=579405 RepID=C6C5L4_MUSP7|nr:hypothetical protein [Musicola paradisiaca]ACS83827.1 hypothetical protein Dd703_0008 [Musicola paradisiaca Ech703]
MINIHPYDTYIAIGLIICFWFYFNKNFTEKNAQEGPGLLITIGIGATFFGITIGLLSFDMNDVEKSLPELINGIKTAFVASFAGVFAALIIKIRHIFIKVNKTDDTSEEGATIDDIVRQLKKSDTSLDKLHYSLVGNEEASLLTQLKLIRTDQNDQLGNLHKAFIEFAQKQAENNSKALIDALREVIRDFNEKISDQFGENFKQLNDAVGKINDWQEQYRQQMQEMIEQQKQTTINMQQASEGFTQIVQQSQSFGQVAEDIHNTIGMISILEQTLRENLTLLASVIDATKNGLPEIEQKVIAMVSDISNGAQASTSLITQHIQDVSHTLQSSANDFSLQLNSSAENMASAVVKQNSEINQTIHEISIDLKQQVSDIAKDLVHHQDDITQTLKLSTSQFTQQLNSSAENMAHAVTKQSNEMHQAVQKTSSELNQLITGLEQELTKYIQRHNESITGHLSEMTKNTAQQVTVLDKELSEALKKSLDTLGQQLGSLSTKFAQDYTPLTEKLKEVVRLAETLKA